jgi:hypothetical protein
MKISEIIFFDINSSRLSVTESSATIFKSYNAASGLLWLQKALLDKGIESQVIPASSSPQCIDDKITQLIKKNSADGYLAVAGFSCCDHMIEEAIRRSKQLMKSGSRIITIAGGASFYGHQFCRQCVAMGHFHAVNRGGCLPAVELIEDICNGKIKFTDYRIPFKNYPSPNGLYVVSDSGPIGKKFGKHPIFEDEVPISLAPKRDDEDTSVICLPVKGDCRNACGYCASVNPPAQPQTAIVKGVERIFERCGTDNLEIRLDGNSPLSPANIKQNLNLLSAINSILPNTLVSSYIDPGHLLDNKHFQKVLEAIVKGKIRTLTFGLDAATEEMAEKIGRNFIGKPRIQECLDEEIEAVIRLVTKSAEEIEKTDRQQLNVKFHYIISPFDDGSTVKKALDNLYRLGMKTLHKFVEPQFVFWPLWPLMGTWINKHYENIKLETPPFRNWNWKLSKLPEDIISVLTGNMNIARYRMPKKDFYFANLSIIGYIIALDNNSLPWGINFDSISTLKQTLINLEEITVLYNDFKDFYESASDDVEERNFTRKEKLFLAYYLALKNYHSRSFGNKPAL